MKKKVVTKSKKENSSKRPTGQNTNIVRLDDIAKHIAEKMNFSKTDAKNSLIHFREFLFSCLSKGKEVYFAKCFKMSNREIEKKSLRNPKTGATILIPKRKKIYVKLCDYIKNIQVKNDV